MIIKGDCLEELKKLPSESVDMVMTSPPYWALRDYGVEGQLGLEPTFQEYINKLCDIFDEVKRVLKKEGTCWVNMGDTYNAHSTGNGNVGGIEKKNKPLCDIKAGNNRKVELPDKCLLQIPSRFAIEMCNRGWILRNEIIWYKPNCMPSSVKDRFTVDFEKIFFFTKNKKYYFETQYETATKAPDKQISANKYDLEEYPTKRGIAKARCKDYRLTGRNKRCVWRITTKPYKEAHFATYPEELCETPIKSGCPEFVCKKCGKARERILETYNTGHITSKSSKMRNEKGQNCSDKTTLGGSSKIHYKEKGYTDCGCNAGWESGIVLDPFFGAGTTGLVALKQNKKFIGIELNPEYVEIAEARLKPYIQQSTLDKNLAYVPSNQSTAIIGAHHGN